MQKQTSSTQSEKSGRALEKFVSSPYALLVVAGVALACVMACALGMALALAPGIAQTRAIILNAEAARVAEEQRAKITPTSAAAKVIQPTAVMSATAVAVAPSPTPPPTPGKPPLAQSPSPAPPRSPTPALPPATPVVAPSLTPVVPSATPVAPVIVTTVAPVLPPTFTPVPSATPAPTASPSATPAPPPATATAGPTPTQGVYPPGATLISGTVKISAVHPDLDFPANEYIELTNTGAQNVALKDLQLLINNPSLDPPVRYIFGSGITLEPGLTCRIFTGAGGSGGGGGGTSSFCSGLAFKDRTASVLQASEAIELRDKDFALLAVYVYVR